METPPADGHTRARNEQAALKSHGPRQIEADEKAPSAEPDLVVELLAEIERLKGALSARSAENAPAAARLEVHTAAKNEEIALKSGGQRRISLLWECTQAAIAVMTVATALGCCVYMIVTDKGSDSAFMLVGNVAILVVNMYFTRTNHKKVGGPGGEIAGTR